MPHPVPCLITAAANGIWLDTKRGIGGYVAIDDYTRENPGAVYSLVLNQIIPLQQQAVDEARAAVGEN